jgi:peptide/nickel transport system ATP-binding protein
MENLRGDLLDISNLKVIFDTYAGQVKALNGVELWMNHGERLGIVGETGCGKSVTALSIMRLIEEPGRIIEGSMLFGDREGNGNVDLAALPEDRLNTIRGSDISMIFQEPKAALNPVIRVGPQIVEGIVHRQKRMHMSGGESEVSPSELMHKMLERVGLDWQRTEKLYPHELSGGMAQRVMIAMALVSRPRLLIADEPTSALDVTIQAQVLNLLDDLVRETNTAVILITHAMGIAAQFCDTIAVMYAGNVVEYGPVLSLFEHPMHPYTQGLLRAVARIGHTEELMSIPGTVPDLVSPPAGCRFHPRCPFRKPECERVLPGLAHDLSSAGDERHQVACLLYQSGPSK